MTLKQIQTYVVGVLLGWLPNKNVLDKFDETADGRLTYNGVVIGVTEEQLNQSIEETLQELAQDTAAPLITNVDVQEISGTVKVNGLSLTCQVGTEVESIVVTMNESVFLAEGASPNVQQVVKNADGVVIPEPTVSSYYGPMSIQDNVITVTPIPNNTVAGLVGTVDFTIPSGVIIDAAGNSRPYSLTLKVTE